MLHIQLHINIIYNADLDDIFSVTESSTSSLWKYLLGVVGLVGALM